MNPLTALPQIWIGELDRTNRMVLAWFKNVKCSEFFKLKSWVSKLQFQKYENPVILKGVFYDSWFKQKKCKMKEQVYRS